MTFTHTHVDVAQSDEGANSLLLTQAHIETETETEKQRGSARCCAPFQLTFSIRWSIDHVRRPDVYVSIYLCTPKQCISGFINFTRNIILMHTLWPMYSLHRTHTGRSRI